LRNCSNRLDNEEEELQKHIKLPGLVGILLLLIHSLAYYASAEVVEIRIEDKAAGFDLPSQNGSPQVLFLVFTDRGVFNVGWEPLFLDFRAAERYHALEVGKRYSALVAGWRIPATNWYPRIVGIVN
jgi:hypothetical protein